MNSNMTITGLSSDLQQFFYFVDVIQSSRLMEEKKLLLKW